MTNIVTSIKKNYKLLGIIYSTIAFIFLAFFWVEPHMWASPTFKGAELDRWLYFRFFQTLTFVFIGIVFNETQSDKQNFKPETILMFCGIHAILFFYTLFLDFSFHFYRHDSQPLANWYPLAFLLIVSLLGFFIIKIVFIDKDFTLLPDILFIILALFFSNGKKGLSEFMFNLSFSFLFILLVCLSYLRANIFFSDKSVLQKEQENTNNAKNENSSILFMKIFTFGLWLFIFSSFIVLANTNTFDFSFIAIYLLFCVIGLIFLMTLGGGNFYYILFTVVFLVLVLFFGFRTFLLNTSSSETIKYLTDFSLLISVLLLLISIFGINYMKIKGTMA